MDRLNRRMAIGLGITALMAASSVAMAEAEALRRVRVNGLNLSYRDYGPKDSGLVIVALSGLGDGMESFKGVASAIAAEARLLLYDRAGYGQSEAASGVHDAARAANELLGLLDALEIKTPVVLLGHSLGGVFAQYFAAKYPSRVKALILAETRPTGMTRACRAQKLSGCTFPTLLKYALPGAGPREADALQLSEDQAEAAGGSEVPTLILVRSGGNKPVSFDGVWLAQQKLMQTHYPNSLLKQAPKGGHYIHNEARDWFLAQVMTFLKSLRTQPI